MPQTTTPRSRNRDKRSLSSYMADRLYPGNSRPEEAAVAEEEGQALGEALPDESPDAESSGRTPMSIAAGRMYGNNDIADAGAATRQGRTQLSAQDPIPSQGDNDAESLGAESRRGATSPVVQTFLNSDPLAYLPKDGVLPASSITEQAHREAQALAQLIKKMPEEECSSLERDIGLEKGTITKLSRAIKEGRPMGEYGVIPHADSQGYVNNEIVSRKSYTYQALVKLLESDQWKAFTSNLWIITGGALTGNLNRARAMKEKERSEWVLNGMNEAYDRYCRR